MNVATTVRLAQWLKRHESAVIGDEAAGEILDELTDCRQRIERTINRPIPRKWLGYCPTWNEGTRKACGRELWAPGDAIETWCRDCRTTHNCNRLQLLLVNDLQRAKMTSARIRELNRRLPEEYRVPERTLRRWINEGKLKPRGWQRLDGTRKITQHSTSDQPLYLWADLRKLHEERNRQRAG